MSYKVEEPDGTLTVYDNNGNFKFKQDPDWSLVPAGYNNSNQNNELIIPGTSSEKSNDGSFGWREAIELGLKIAALPNPFSSTGQTIGQSVAAGGKQAINWVVDKVKNKRNKTQKTTKPQTQTQTSPTKYKTITYPGYIMDDFEKNSIKKFELFQRKSVPWKMPSVEVGITRMTGFEPFSSTADQTFNVFYGGGSIDPFLRS